MFVPPDAMLRQARQASGLTQAQLAERLGIAQPTLSRLERPGSNPTVATLAATLAAAGHRLELRAVRAASDADVGQIRECVARTPAERLRSHDASYRNTRDLMRRARRLESDGGLA